MKLNRNFKINNMLWLTITLVVLVIGAIWANSGLILSRSGGNRNLLPTLNQNLVQNPLMNAPVNEMNGLTNQINGSQNQIQSMNPVADNSSAPITALMVQEGISHVVSMVRPSVVGVSRTTAPSQPAPSANGLSQNGGLSYISPFTSGSGSQGSGVIIDSRGYVLTTFQTVGKDTVVNVKLFSGTEQNYKADVVAVDSQTDLVVLKLRAQGVFPAVVIGNSNLIEVGDIVFAIGSPFGFSQTVTMGIVSSHNRNLNINGVRYPDMIQTDASINQGNNGGPLVNIRGEIVGINMATFMPGNQYAGIGFAVPINNILNFINSNI